MGKGTLKGEVARRVVSAVVAHEQVLVSPMQSQALRAELASALSPTLDDWQQGHPQASDCARMPPDYDLESMAEQITEQIHCSDHVEDIYVTDGAIRREALLALRDTLMGAMHGEIPLLEKRPNEITVQFEDFADMARFIAQALSPTEFRQALEIAAKKVKAELLVFNNTEQHASFRFRCPASADAIALEEAIVAHFLSLAERDQVALPAVEQLLRIESGGLDQPWLRCVLRDACALHREHTGCIAHCQVVDAETLRLRLTPLTEFATENLDAHYDELVAILANALATAAPPENAGPSSQAPRSSRRHAAAAAPESGARMSRPSVPPAAADHPPSSRSGLPPRRNRRTGG